AVSEFLCQLRKQKGDGAIRSQRVTVVIGRVVTESPKSNGVLVQVLGIAYESLDEITAPHIMGQIAEEPASKWIVAHVLNYRSAIGVGMRLAQRFCRSARESFQQERFDIAIPCEIDYCLVGKDREGRR